VNAVVDLYAGGPRGVAGCPPPVGLVRRRPGALL